MKKMNRMKWVAVMLIIGFMAATAATAGEQPGVVGKVEKTDQGLAIITEDGMKFLLKGKDLSGLVGKTVWATGTLSESESGKVFTVSSVEVDDD